MINYIDRVAMSVFHFLPAVGEDEILPAVLKSVAQNVLGTTRSPAMGIVNSGAAIGAVSTPPLVG